jgi:hypothetical protein
MIMDLVQNQLGRTGTPLASAYVEFLVRVEPRLQRGPLHRLRVTQKAIEISTVPGLYGNKLSTTLKSIPHSRISEVRYRHAFLKTRCLVRYEGELGQPETLPAEPISLIGPPPSGRLKLLYGLLLLPFPIVLRLALSGPFDIRGFLIFGTLFGFIALGAVGIDYIRLHTAWHPLVKITGAILVFAAAFMGIIAMIGFIENLH